MNAISLRPRTDLRQAQRFMARTVYLEKAKLIVSAMGSGKSGATLTALRRLLDEGEIVRVIVIGPKRVAKDTWPDEILTWAHTACLSFAACTGTEKERVAALDAGAEITIINRENLPWLWEVLGRGARWDFDCVIVDESSMFKDGRKRTTRKRTKRADGKIVMSKGGSITRFGVLAAARKLVRRIYLLTGTPGDLEHLWGQIYLIDQGERLGKSKDDFYRRWFTVNQFTYEIKPREGAKSEIMALISDIMVSMPKQILTEPPVLVTVKVQLPPKILEEYRRFARTLVSESYDIEAVNQGVLTNKLLQFANGAMYNEMGETVPIHREKHDALDEIIERAAGESVLIFYSFKFDLEQIRKRYPHAVVLNECDTAVTDWNEGKIKILIAHPASCAHGLNLQYGGHIAIWFGLTWSLELYLQANERLPRPGQTQLVVIYRIIAEQTVDEKLIRVLDVKEANQSSIIEAVATEWRPVA